MLCDISKKTALISAKICQTCNALYLSESGNRKWCDECLKKMLVCPVCGGKVPHTWNRYCSRSCSAKHAFHSNIHLQEVFAKERNSDLRKERARQACKKQKGMPRPHTRGPLSPHWKGGVTGSRRVGMGLVEYRMWRETIFEKDKHTCRNCRNDKGGNLNAHHIKPWAQHPESRYDVNNGITLCKLCHQYDHFLTRLHKGKFVNAV
jgi:hypothetical protein